MELQLTQKQFRRLLDLVYIGNWVLNSTRGDDRIREYDAVESAVFANCLSQGMVKLVESYQGELIPRSGIINLLYCLTSRKRIVTDRKE